MIIRYSLIIAMAVSLMLGACAAGPNPVKEVDFDKLVPEMERKTHLVKQFRAEFIKTRHAKVFDRDLTVNGTLLFQKPGNFQLTLTGDVNVEILSNGKVVTMIHDGKDQEFFFIHGARDASRMSDPLMALLQTVGDGGLRKFAVTNQTPTEMGVSLELTPSNDSQFETVSMIHLDVLQGGEMKKVVIDFKNGNWDETVFTKWSLLTSDDPEIVTLNKKLDTLAEAAVEKDYRALRSRRTYSMLPAD